MSAKKRPTLPTGGQSAAEVAAPVSPPRKSRWQLVCSSILVGLWLIFLAWMAFTS
jgi:hypothetical protein